MNWFGGQVKLFESLPAQSVGKPHLVVVAVQGGPPLFALAWPELPLGRSRGGEAQIINFNYLLSILGDYPERNFSPGVKWIRAPTGVRFYLGCYVP